MRYIVNKWTGTEGLDITVEVVPEDLCYLSRERFNKLQPAFSKLLDQALQNMTSPTEGEVSKMQFATFMQVLLSNELERLNVNTDQYLGSNLIFQKFREQLIHDINRPNGRWGIHGNTAVDDDYFKALEYVVNELDKLLINN